MQYYVLSFFLLLVVSCSTPASTATASASTAPAAAPKSYAGEWAVKVSDTPAGTVAGVMTLAEGEDGLTGSFNAGGNSTELRSVERTDDGLLIKFYSMEYQTDVDLRLQGMPGDDTLEGMALGSYKTVATRK